MSFIWTGAGDTIDSLLTFSSTWTANGGSNNGEIDVVEIVGALSTLYNYVLNKLLPNLLVVNNSRVPAAAVAPVTTKPSNQSSPSGAKSQSQAASTSASTSNSNNSNNSNNNTATTQAPIDPKKQALNLQVSSVSTLILVNEVRNKLLSHLDTFVEDQYNWIVDQKSDPKRAGVAPPVARYVTLMFQIQEMMDKQVYLLFYSSQYNVVHSNYIF